MPHLVLIDGPNYVYRAFHAVRHLSNTKGEPTNAVFGYVQMLRSVLDKLKPTHVAVAFDPKDGSFRNTIYPEYKAHRPPMPQELAVQWPRVWEITRAFNFPLICLDNYEADDVITTLARRGADADWDVTIVSSDKDLMQLVGGRIHMLDTMKNVTYDKGAVQHKWGVPPERIRDLLALVGDSSDNIPGVPGIGPKTAAELLSSYGTLDDVLAHAGEIKQPKRRESLLTHAETARLAYKLIGLCDTAPVVESLEELAVVEPDRGRLATVFGELEFRRLNDEFNGDAPPPATRSSSPPPVPPAAPVSSGHRFDHVVDDEHKLADLVAKLTVAELIAIDSETTSLQTHDADIVGLSFSCSEGEAWYVPIGHRAADMLTPPPKQLPRHVVLEALRPVIEDATRPKCGHNLKYDEQVLRRAGVTLAGIQADSMLLAYCLYPGRYPPKLDHVAKEYLGHSCISYEQVAGKGAKQIGFAEVPLETAVPYACEDAEVAFRLTALLRDRLAAENRLKRHDDIELPLSRVLADMEWTGTKLDRAMLARLSNGFGERIRGLEQRIHAAAGQSFNIQSPKQLGELLYETLGLPGGKKTKSGQWATDQSVLEKLAEEHEVPRLILEARQLAKLKSTYTDALQSLIHPQTGRVHTSYNQAITSTGRLSSSDPNLQNIPIRSDEGREIRKAFVAEPGHVLISADYSQIELRLMAHFSGDEQLTQAFARGEDIHAATAAAVNQVPLEAVSGEMRRRAKAVNFGILYGMSAFGLTRQLGIERAEAQMFIDAYFHQYPKIRTFMDATLETARTQGFVETLLGHRVYVPDILARNGMHRQYAERTAINAPLQGSAADIIKVAMIRLHRRLQDEMPEAGLILQVHDELVVEAPADSLEQATAIIRREMEQAVQLHVPLTVDIGAGTNWYDAHRL